MTQPLRETFHPGIYLQEELEAREWTQKNLAEMINKPVTDISLMITGNLSVTPETAILLGDAFGTGPEYWMNLERNARIR